MIIYRINKIIEYMFLLLLKLKCHFNSIVQDNNIHILHCIIIRSINLHHLKGTKRTCLGPDRLTVDVAWDK